MKNQVDALARAFFARFFESELTAGLDDMKQSFFWLIAALAMPGIFIPTLMSFEWGLWGRIRGYEYIQMISMAEKSFYLGFTMVSAGALTAIAWTSLLPDKRDTLILGAMPVKPSVVVFSKLVALAGYIGLIAVGTHLAGTLLWASLLGNEGPLAFMARSFAAHFIACAGLTATTALAVAGAQGLTLALLGPRLFRRISVVLQVIVVGSLAALLALLPALNTSAVHTISGGARAQPWLLWLPPMWFLGLYESILGSRYPIVEPLAARAIAAFGIAAATVLITYPFAYRRLMVSTVEAGGYQRSAFSLAAQGTLVRIAGRAPAVKAAAQFFAATVGRVERHRFILAITIGLALAWSLPGLRAYHPAPVPDASVLALPIAVMMFLLVGLRVASVLPGDPRAAWLFEVHDISRADARQAVERTMLLIGVLPPIAFSSPVYWMLWGPTAAITHAVVMASLGVAAAEVLIWHCETMPCGRPWAPARMGFGRRWPLHAALFLLVSGGIPRLEVLLFNSISGTIIFTSLLVILAILVRTLSARHEIVPIYDDVDPVAGVLRIN